MSSRLELNKKQVTSKDWDRFVSGCILKHLKSRADTWINKGNFTLKTNISISNKMFVVELFQGRWIFYKRKQSWIKNLFKPAQTIESEIDSNHLISVKLLADNLYAYLNAKKTLEI